MSWDAVQRIYCFERRAPAHFPLIRQAAWDERAWEISYLNIADVSTQRRIMPLSVVFLDRSLMCLAYCTLRQDFRRFHLNGMDKITLSEESFRQHRLPLLHAFLAKIHGETNARRQA